MSERFSNVYQFGILQYVSSSKFQVCDSFWETKQPSETVENEELCSGTVLYNVHVISKRVYDVIGDTVKTVSTILKRYTVEL